MLSPSDWVYRGEGAANVVLSYAGSSEEFKGKVLRLRKRLAGTQSFSPRQNHTYLKQLISPLLGEHYVNPGAIIQVPKDFIAAVNQSILAARPEKRRGTPVDESSLECQLINDVGRPFLWHPLPPSSAELKDAATYCVEIKPKWGFLPSSRFISREMSGVKLSRCRYCMHQWLKIKHGHIDERSKYCPLDLFSNSPARVARALHSLIETPQNNVRIFRDGDVLLTGDKKGQPLQDPVAQLRHLDSQLSDSFPASATSPDPSLPHLQSLIRVLCAILTKEPVLARLQAAQRLDHLDIEGLKILYDNFIHNHPAGSSHWLWDGVFDSPEWLDAVQRRDFCQVDEQLESVAQGDALRFIAQYLLSATVKDCSLMLSIQRVPAEYSEPSGGFPTVDDCATQARYRFTVAVVDLDPKLFSNIPKYYQDDLEIVENYKTEATPSDCHCSGKL